MMVNVGYVVAAYLFGLATILLYSIGHAINEGIEAKKRRELGIIQGGDNHV